jgi:branched-chain amino acid transport system substrate-binding protein
MSFWRVSGWIAVLFWVFLATQATAQEPIRIGVIADQTGEWAADGLAASLAVETVETMLHSQNGPGGHAMEWLVVDGGSDPTQYAARAHWLLKEKKVIAGLGGWDDASALAAGDVFARYRAPFASLGAAGPGVALISHNVVMVRTPDNDLSRAVAQYVILRLGFPSFALVQDSASPTSLRKTRYLRHFARSFSGKEIPAGWTLDLPAEGGDLSPLIERLKSDQDLAAVRAWVLTTGPRDAARFASRIRSEGLDMVLIAAGGLDLSLMGSPDDPETPEAPGAWLPLAFHPHQPGLSGPARTFAAGYAKKHGRDPGEPEALAFDAMTAMAQASDQAVRNLGQAEWDRADLETRRRAAADALRSGRCAWTTQPFDFTREGWPKRSLVWARVYGGSTAFVEFQPYETFTPPGLDTLPFK